MARTQNTEWLPELDLIRAAACLMVVVLHSAAGYFYSLQPEGRWLAANLIDSLVRPCVPLFFMLSGALLLRSATKEDFLSFIGGRLRKIAFPLLFWSSLACLDFVIRNSKPPVYFFSFASLQRKASIICGICTRL